MSDKFYAVGCGRLILFIYHENMPLIKKYLCDTGRFSRIETLLEYCRNQGGKAYIQKPGINLAEIITYFNVNNAIKHYSMQMPGEMVAELKKIPIINAAG